MLLKMWLLREITALKIGKKLCMAALWFQLMDLLGMVKILMKIASKAYLIKRVALL